MIARERYNSIVLVFYHDISLISRQCMYLMSCTEIYLSLYINYCPCSVFSWKYELHSFTAGEPKLLLH